ncbi:spermatogenesis-associated protein 46 [Strix uralensis]|uniref:spermatogenesis-associated protein 46 n=1 Tax=Strix uralensis TaxID=36305 RepID=UPI003DA79641
MVQEPHTSYTRVMESFTLPTISVSIKAMPHSTGTRSSEAPGPASLPGKPGACQLWPGRGCRQLALPVGSALHLLGMAMARLSLHSTVRACGQMGCRGVWLGIVLLQGWRKGTGWVCGSRCFLGTWRGFCSRTPPELHWFLPHVFQAGVLKAVSADTGSASPAPPSPPLCQCSSPQDGSSGLLGEPCAVLVPRCLPASCAHLYTCMLRGQTGTEPATSASHEDREEGSPSTAPNPVGGQALAGTPNSLQILSSTACEPTAPAGSELPARTCNIYRPWFSPYSYFTSTKGAAQQHLGSLSSSQATSTQEHQESDDLSEIVCFSSGSSDEPQPPERDRMATSRATITVQDILTISQWQPEAQHGYHCLSCCRVFPTLWSVKTHIQHSSQEGYSCNVFYCRLKALWVKEGKAQEAAAPRVSVQPRQPGSHRRRALLHRS